VYSLPDIVRVIIARRTKWTGIKTMKMLTEFWLESLKGREFGRHRRRWEENIKVYLKKIG
jgi:hypothetical protein